MRDRGRLRRRARTRRARGGATNARNPAGSRRDCRCVVSCHIANRGPPYRAGAPIDLASTTFALPHERRAETSGGMRRR
ncbi:hypothetical protein C6V04_14980 [Burkholderia multivorans]|uniref:Uncharacterized protein n=1 Tax=Burkholderia multivorans CGD2 TaxID=513052 RepID=B9BQW1_9BURK|nr:hypothetical protein BURMUCGD2_1059 [Burkholderia multivorans CGD2]PRE31238.1 hypothetical protein C6P79_03635 [Burkholderia multivorans]PRG92531.1 hypothetical protein C6V04_14980 [Burkholderia multivorans]QET31195.1 hypothetical protein FOB31_15870 [Burkholderia multivorans]QET42087.1 hypothetical protein FOB30_27995 [Burkholderia multivorans]